MLMNSRAIASRKWHRKNVEEGKCRCGRKRTPGFKTCEKCREHNREAVKKRQHRLRPIFAKLGICTRCMDRLAVEGRKNCAVCAEYNTDWLKANRKKTHKKEKNDAA